MSMFVQSPDNAFNAIAMLRKGTQVVVVALEPSEIPGQCADSKSSCQPWRVASQIKDVLKHKLMRLAASNSLQDAYLK